MVKFGGRVKFAGIENVGKLKFADMVAVNEKFAGIVALKEKLAGMVTFGMGEKVGVNVTEKVLLETAPPGRQTSSQ